LLHVRTGVAPDAKLGVPGQEQDGLQQSQYRVVFPEPEAWALTVRRKGRRVTIVEVEKNILK